MCGLPFHPCGTCDYCQDGPESRRQYCQNTEGVVGVLSDGCFAEYVRVDARFTTSLPDEVSLLSAAPLACAGRTVWRAVLQAELQPGQTLAIVGSGGGLGHLGIKFAKGMGLRVVGIDARDEGLSFSTDCGADEVVDARLGKEEAARKVHILTQHRGADATINLADADGAAALACAVTRMHGTVVQIAQPELVKIPFAEFIMRDIRMKGSVLCSPQESLDMVQFVADNNIQASTKEFDGLDSIHHLLELVESGKLRGKAVVVVDKSQLDKESQSHGA
jgi:D-arabinose 1-dehydrogenase-like Zn-dependent alcohol dehydrogenase